MGHVIPGTSAPDRHESGTRRYIDARWALSAALTRQAAVITGRPELIVAAVTATEPGAPGVFYPDRSAIEVEAALFEKPPKGRRAPAPADPTTRPVGFGVFVHETAHATHTRWRCPDGTGAAQTTAALLLEEVRIEGQQLRRRAGDRHWLRHSAKALILSDTATSAAAASRWQAAQALALVYGRADAGVLKLSEARPLISVATRQLGTQMVTALREIWRRVLGIDDDDAAGMLQAAADWCTLLGTDPDGPDPAEMQGPATVAQIRAAAVVAQAVGVSMSALSRTLAREPGPDVTPPAAPNVPALSEAANGVLVRDSKTGPIAGHRVPTALESRQAAILADRLSHAGLRGRASVTVASALPPGRLDMRAVLARDAQKAAGGIPTAAMWQRSVRKTIPSPPLRVGIAADVSGSMGAFAKPTASTAWILAQATHRAGIEASSATAAFGGSTVTPITRPGRAPAHITEFKADAVGHPLAAAIDHLDRSLGLARPGVARLLVIVSDGHYRGNERAHAQARIDHLRGTGCAVLWIAMPDQNPQPLLGAELAEVRDPAVIGTVIAQAAVKALAS
jgi:hypothetical protein